MELSSNILGETAGLKTFDGRLDNQDVIMSLCRQSQQNIRIFTPDLEPSIYDHLDLIQSLSALATKNRKTLIRILLKDSTRAIKTGHRLIELSRRLTSSIILHRMPSNIENRDAAYFIADDCGYCHKPMGTLYQGQFDYHDKIKVRDLGRSFESAWELSRPDPEMRSLFI